jgi:hypothetical protein
VIGDGVMLLDESPFELVESPVVAGCPPVVVLDGGDRTVVRCSETFRPGGGGVGLATGLTTTLGGWSAGG